MDALLRDIRYAARTLTAQPGWTAAAVVCLVIAAGANSAAFSFVHALVFRPLPFSEPDRLVMVAVREHGAAQTHPFSQADYRELAPAVRDLADLIIRSYLPVALAAGDETRMVQSELVSPNYFEMLRVKPLAGRFFHVDADAGGIESEIVISHRLWTRRFGGDPSIVGRTVRVNGRALLVCGIAPEGFVGAMRLLAADAWLPASLYASLTNVVPAAAERVVTFGVVGRLQPGFDRDSLRARLDVLLAGRTADQHSGDAAKAVVIAASGFGVPPAARGAALGGSMLLGGLMSLLIGVAIANVASLVLARMVGRRRELGVRFALGASRWRVFRQLACEGVLLSFAGAGGGFLVAMWTTRILAAGSMRLPEHLAFAVDIQPDLWVAAYALGAAMVTAIALSVAPARWAARVNLIDVLKSSGPGSGEPSTSRTLTAIVVAQVALSTVLLVGAGLLVRTYLNAEAVDPVFRPQGVVTVTLDLNQIGPRVDGPRFYEELLTRARALPGVDRASLSRESPLASSGQAVSISSEEERARHRVDSFVVTPGYFETLGVPLLTGRDFGPLDRAAAPVAIVNETLARRLWPDGSVIGRTLRLDSGERVEVIAVVKDAKYQSLVESPRAVFYRPFAQVYSPQMTLLVRGPNSPESLLAPLRAAVRTLNPDLAIVDARTLEQQVDDALAQRRSVALYLSAVCALGLMMSGVGLFGVIAYGVRTRSREIGIRMALGAAVAQVRGMVLVHTLRVAALGLALGLCGALALTRFITRLLYGVSPIDPATLLSVGGVVLAVAFGAAYLPARWATKVDPMIVLRQE